MKAFRSNTKMITLFLLPALLIYLLLAVIPIIQSIYFAFFEWPGIHGVPLEYVGLKNFARMFSSEEFWHSVKNVTQFTVINLVMQIGVGYGLALLLAKRLRGYKLFKTVFFAPVVLPLAAVSLLWTFIYYPSNTGILNMVLEAVGLGDWSTMWLLDRGTALNAVAITNAWTGFGYHMVIGFAALSAIPNEIIESAQLDGAAGFKMLFRIKIPLIWESLKISVILIITGCLKNFDIIFVMTGGGPNGLTHVPSTLMYYEAFRYDNYGLGSAISVFIFVISILLTLMSLKVMQRKNDEIL